VHTSTHVNSRTDVVIPGLGPVTRDDRLKLTDTHVRGRAGADMLFGEIPVLGWLLGGRAEVDYGPGGVGSMLKLLVVPKIVRQ
jgi:hypothetical protein